MSNDGTMRGFTLLELMVVLVIAALMIAVVPPLLSAAGLSSQVRGAARELAAGLRMARSEAVTTERSAALMIDLDKRDFTVTGRSGSRRLPASKKVQIRLYTARSQLIDGRRGGIRFFPDGSSTGGHVALIEGQTEYRVNVNWLTGRVSIDTRHVEPQ